MKLLLFPLLYFVFSFQLLGQSSRAVIGADKTIFRKVLNQQFSSLITGSAKNSIGNFAALDLKEPEVSFSGSHIDNSGSILTINATGGVSDGFFQLFNNSSLNTKVALDLQYNMLGLKHQTLVYYNEPYNDYLRKLQQVRDRFDAKLVAADHEQGKTLLWLRHTALLRQLQSLSTAEGTQTNTVIRDSIRYEMAVVQANLDSVRLAILAYRPKTTLMQIIRTERNIELDSL